MNTGDKYVKLVEWSDEDGCFIGSCPELFYGSCHGTGACRARCCSCSAPEMLFPRVLPVMAAPANASSPSWTTD